MLTVQRGVSLRAYNTFGLDVRANYFADLLTEADLDTLFNLDQFKTLPLLLLGGGSNVLLTQDFPGLVIRVGLGGIGVVEQNEQHMYVRAGAGVNWHELVRYCVENDFAGMENLSLIPGTTGAAPIQNIGAYGVEVEQIFDSLEAVHLKTGQKKRFSHADCQFGYRHSVFKDQLKGQYLITSVTFRLLKTPVFQTHYGAIGETLTQMGIGPDTLSILAISNAVIRIRQSKLPDPAQIGNAGSFFKNPEIPTEQFEKIKRTYPALPGYPLGSDRVKVPAGWLIEQAGWKGYRHGDAGVHAKQALVLVNYGHATGAELLALARQVQESVKAKFGIDITPEVNIV